MERPILAVMTDLFFLVQITEGAKRAGCSVAFAQTRETALEHLRAKPPLVILDLNCGALDPLGIIRFIKSDPATAHIATMGFVSHVNADLRKQAEESGCDVVVARSAFAQKLAETIKSLAVV